MQINSIRFDAYHEEAHEFYMAYGWVVLTQVLRPVQCQQLQAAWEILCEKYRQEIGCSPEAYRRAVTQWRDLWKTETVFHQMLTEYFAPLSAKSFELPGTRLLHDHIISKSSDSNGEVPWHQDSMYWPADRTGMSLWMSFSNVPVKHGCLEVINGSHQWGISQPVDFMSNAPTPADKATPTYLPVNAGEIIMLHSRTWHRSQPTQTLQTQRPAYISLWIPPHTKYYPLNAQWHPLNQQVMVEPGEFLNEDEFPIFGKPTTSLGNSLANQHEGVPSPTGMFNAKKRVQTDIERLLGRQGKLSQLLQTAQQRTALLHVLKKTNPETDPSQLSQLIETVWVSATAYELHRSRNVFNSAYAHWAQLSI